MLSGWTQLWFMLSAYQTSRAIKERIRRIAADWVDFSGVFLSAGVLLELKELK